MCGSELHFSVLPGGRRNGAAALRRCVQAERGGACSGGSAAGTLRGQSPRKRARPPSRRSQEQPGTSPRVPPADTDTEKPLLQIKRETG